MTIAFHRCKHCWIRLCQSAGLFSWSPALHGRPSTMLPTLQASLGYGMGSSSRLLRYQSSSKHPNSRALVTLTRYVLGTITVRFVRWVLLCGLRMSPRVVGQQHYQAENSGAYPQDSDSASAGWLFLWKNGIETWVIKSSNIPVIS